MHLPDQRGYFGAFGGRFVPETLLPALAELTDACLTLERDRAFRRSYLDLLARAAGRPTPLYEAKNLTRAWAGARVFLKREDLNHTGAHKINNCLGQGLLAARLGKRRVIAETGAGQHGVATATACALLGLACRVYMGTVDMGRQQPNVEKMELLGAEVVPVESGSRTLKDAVNEAIRDWGTNVETTHYLIGSAVGPHPYPAMVRSFQSVIGREARRQMLAAAGRLPDAIVACVGGGSNAIGMFHPFLERPAVRLVGVEAYGRGPQAGENAASIGLGTPGVLHGAYAHLLQDEEGQVLATHSVSAGLDYPAVGPEHSYLADQGRVTYTSATDEEALHAFEELAQCEGIVPALESAHALARARDLACELGPDRLLLVNLSGRGDKDMENYRQARAAIEADLPEAVAFGCGVPA